MSTYKLSKDVKAPTAHSKKINIDLAKKLGININNATNTEVDLAKANCLKKVDDLVIKDENGKVVWDLLAFNFLKKQEVPDTINPSLWLNGKANYEAGVFSVLGNNIIQIRGLDIANLTLVRGKTGWIVVDVLSTVEAASYAITLAEEALGEDIKNNIKAIIISHSHGDHFGGIKGVVNEDQVGPISEGKIPVYAPIGFDVETIKEHVLAGTAMIRRADYQFGTKQEISETGRVTVGLGLAMANGTLSYIGPTDFIDKDQTIVIDGLEVDFQLTLGTEAPAEMNNYFRVYKALWLAENCNGTLHNLYPIRGAQTRYGAAWARYIEEALVRYGDISDVVFHAHNWPRTNSSDNPNVVKEYLKNTAAIYKFIHDQTLLYANQGYTPKEIAKKIKIPDGLQKNWYTRPYYGSVEINARAVYNKYLGFYNGNPIDLNPLTEIEVAKKLVEYIGSEDTILEKAKIDFEKGNYQWVAEITSAIIYANPKNEDARLLAADAFEQLAYQAESGIWRNAYTTAASELRYGVNKESTIVLSQNDMTKNMTTSLILDFLGMAIDGDLAAEEDIKFNLKIIDFAAKNLHGSNTTSYLGQEVLIKEKFVVNLYKGALLYYENYEEENIPYVTIPKKVLFALIGNQLDKATNFIDTNNPEILKTLQSYVTDLVKHSKFNIIEP